MRKELIHVDGHVVDHYIAEGDEIALMTGPIRGTVTRADGTVHDVRPKVIPVANHCELAEVMHLIGQRYEAEGHPHHDPEDPFVYDRSHWHDHLSKCPNHGNVTVVQEG